ncbi:amidohydrolase family protein [uncultured Aquimarina sp.]|uniref:amidohydrolase family protein n=1 Tax=uncultured Aquimarina sp. TaxID=575652 RepID=UPI0026086B85|nr:amidohydrolase family protein [uncultured Aquimarina sp.]
MKLKFRKNIIIKVLICIVLLVALALGGEYLWSSHQIKKHTGSLIKVIDPTSYFDSYGAIGIKNVNTYINDSSSFTVKNIVLKNGSIVAIDNIETLKKSINYIDGDGKFLIPGLVDTHTHLLNSKNDLYLYLVNGVTSIAEMFGTETHLEWKKEAENGSISPNMYVASSKVGSQKGFSAEMSKNYGGAIHYQSVESAREGIANFKKEGYDAVKLGSLLNKETYTTIIDEAKKQDIPVIGHLSYDIPLETLYTSGQSQLAHVEEITKSTMEAFGGVGYGDENDYLEYLKKNADSIAIKLRENDIAVSTTIWLMESLPKQKFNLDDFIQSIKLKYANPGVIEGSGLRQGWLPGNNEYENLKILEDPERLKKSKIYNDAYIKAIQIMCSALARNNTTVIVGTDTNVAGVVPGFSFHDEMKSLSNVGFTNRQILNASTIAPAKFMKMKTGKIEVGYESDLILLSKNPLEDITNTKSIEMVFFDNYRIDENGIKRILNKIEEVNNDNRNVEINKYQK